MYILVSDIEKTWVPLPWDGAAFFNYKKEDRKYTTKEFLDFLKKEDFLEIKANENIPMILITHNNTEAKILADEIIHVENGKIKKHEDMSKHEVVYE